MKLVYQIQTIKYFILITIHNTNSLNFHTKITKPINHFHLVWINYFQINYFLNLIKIYIFIFLILIPFLIF